MDNIQEMVDEMINGYFSKSEVIDFTLYCLEFGSNNNIDKETIDSAFKDWLFYKAKAAIASVHIEKAKEYFNKRMMSGVHDQNFNQDEVIDETLRIAAGLESVKTKADKKGPEPDPDCHIQVSYAELLQFAKDARNYMKEPRRMDLRSVEDYFNY